MFSEVDLSGSVMAERGPLAEVDTNVMAAHGAPSLEKAQGAPSLGKVALPDESLLSGKDSLTGEASTLGSGLGRATGALHLFLPETAVHLKKEDKDDHKEIHMEDDEHEVGDAEMDSDDDQFSGESWKENSEKPSIVKNLMGQKEATQTYPRSSLKVLTALELEPNCGDPLIAANLLPGWLEA